MPKDSDPDSEPSSGGHLAAAIAAILLWSTSFVATRLAYDSFAPLTLGALRFVIASALLAAAVFAGRMFVVPARRDLGWMALSGLLGITLYFAMENIGVSLTSASNAALIVGSYPAITILLERIIYGVRVSRLRALGVGMAMFGVYLVAGGDGGEGRDRLLGNIILVLTGIVWAFYNFVTRKVVGKYPGFVVSFYQTLAGTVAFIPLALLERESWRTPTASSVLLLFYLGVLCSVAAFMLYNHGLRRLSPGAAVSLANLIPVLGVLLSVIVLDETIRPAQMAGGAIVIAGVFLSVRK